MYLLQIMFPYLRTGSRSAGTGQSSPPRRGFPTPPAASTSSGFPRPPAAAGSSRLATGFRPPGLAAVRPSSGYVPTAAAGVSKSECLELSSSSRSVTTPRAAAPEPGGSTEGWGSVRPLVSGASEAPTSERGQQKKTEKKVQPKKTEKKVQQKKTEKKVQQKETRKIEVTAPSQGDKLAGPSPAQVVKSTSQIPDYLENSIRKSSKSCYDVYWKKYLKFCEEGSLNIHAAHAIAGFLIFLAEESNGVSASMSARSGLKFHLKLIKPFARCAADSYYVSRIMKTIYIKFRRPVKKAKTLASKDIEAAVSKLMESGSFKDLRTGVFLLLQFCAFARFEEIAQLRVEDVTFLVSGDMELHFLKAKNYDVADGQKCLIGKNPLGMNPVTIVESYMEKLNGSQFLFPSFRPGKEGALVFLGKPVSYKNQLDLFRKSLDNIGLKGDDFSLHSPRTGAVSECVNTGAVQRENIARHVRWKNGNVQMVDYYNQMSIEKRLEPSKALKLYKYDYANFINE